LHCVIDHRFAKLRFRRLFLSQLVVVYERASYAHCVPTLHDPLLVFVHQMVMQRIDSIDVCTRFRPYEFASLPSPSLRRKEFKARNGSHGGHGGHGEAERDYF
jgi:hypothetical protein